jgi:DNA-binding IclR family transcriptional regulator
MSATLIKAQVIGALRTRPLTAGEVAQELGLHGRQASNAIASLVALGAVHQVGERLGRKSHKVAVWGLADFVYERYDCSHSGPTDGFTLPEFRWRTGQ